MRSSILGLLRKACRRTVRGVYFVLLLGAHSVVNGAPGDTELGSMALDGLAAGRSTINGPSVGSDQAMSADGRYVAFVSWSPQLPFGSVPDHANVYLRDRLSGRTELITKTIDGTAANWLSMQPTVNGDARYVAFTSGASNLTTIDPGGNYQVYLRDRQSETTELVSVNMSGTAGNAHSYVNSISADGRFVAFSSHASDLVVGDTNEAGDLFVRDRLTARTERVSVGSSSEQANGGSKNGWISADGRYVVFDSLATNLVAGDTNKRWDVFVRDRGAGSTERVSVTTNEVQSDGDSFTGIISADGRYVAFLSRGSNLGSDGNPQVFFRDRLAGTTQQLTYDLYCTEPAMSSDGRYVAVLGVDRLQLANDDATWLLQVWDRDLHRVERIRVPLNWIGTGNWESDAWPDGLALSGDGHFVAFDSRAPLTPNDHNNSLDVYVRELGGQTTAQFGYAVKPDAMAYGNQALFTSTTLSFWLTNKGTAPLAVTSVGLVGLNPGMFSASNRCGSSLAVGASCSVRVTFRPTSVGAKSAKLRIVAGDNDVRTKALSGTGVVSTFAVSPTALDFGNVPVNTMTAASFVTITNRGSSALPISSITLAGWNPSQFAQTNNCQANLAVGANCTINVVFKPTAPIGSKAALLNIMPGGGAAIRSVSLAGAVRN